MWMIGATLTIIFGGAQFKEVTDLWATKQVRLMLEPDFGKHLSYARSQKMIIQYWSRGLKKERGQLRQHLWAQVTSRFVGEKI
jgi:hypothetical protein